MAAKIIPFSDYAKHPTPRRCYLDSSFVIHLLQFGLTTGTPAVRDAACDTFHARLISDGVQLLASVFTYSELLHIYCFKYPGGMYDEARAFLKKPATFPGERAVKDFLRYHPVDCEAAWRKISYRVQASEFVFQQRNIAIVYPVGLPPVVDKTRDIVIYATILKDAFVGIGSSDAVHLSIATYLGADAVVSMDKGFQTVDGFTIYSA
jgi:hypothetical protein